MSSMWREYLTEVVTLFRSEFKNFDLKEQEKIRERAFDDFPFEPCQIEVLDFGIDGNIVFFLVHDKRLSDMMFKIHEKAKTIEESEFKKKYEFKTFIYPMVDEAAWKQDLGYRLYIFTERSMRFERMMSPRKLVQYFVNDARQELKREQVDVITRSTDGLKESISKISEKDVRDELLASAKKIDTSMQEIKRLDNEIGKVRQLVGVTKEFQDWKLLVSDVDRLKGEHVPREVFESKLRELSTKIEAYEKIEEAYERLSTQQEKVLEQQSSFLKWIKYSTILVPIAVAVIPVIEYLLRYLLKVP